MVDPESVALVQMVVEQRRQEIVGGTDRVEVAGEMKVDVFHRDDLRVSAAGRAALHAEHWPEARLTDTSGDTVSPLLERLAEPDGDGRFPLSGRGRIHPGHQHEPARALVGTERVETDLGLRRPVGDQGLSAEPDVCGHLDDGPHGGGLRDLDIGRNGTCSYVAHGVVGFAWATRPPKQRIAFTVDSSDNSSNDRPRAAATRSATWRT